MTSEQPAQEPSYSVETIKRLAELMSQHDLSEVSMDTEIGRLRMRRGPRGVAAAMPMPMAMHSPAPASAAPAQATPTPAAEPAKPSRALLDVKSEAIGTFYSRPNPESEPYVKVGSKVTPSTVVGLIEAMKMFNEITAGVSGTIVEVLVENQQAVEYGTLLYRVEPS